jgi:hypothetical protein
MIPHGTSQNGREKIMKNIRFLAIATLGAGLFLLAVTILDLMALTDIGHDYVSRSALEGLNITLSAALPEWTTTSGEWQVVTVSSVLWVAFLVLNSITLWLCVRFLKPPVKTQ